MISGLSLHTPPGRRIDREPFSCRAGSGRFGRRGLRPGCGLVGRVWRVPGRRRFTVASDRYSRWATSALDRPRPRRVSTSRSRGVSGARVVARLAGSGGAVALGLARLGQPDARGAGTRRPGARRPAAARAGRDRLRGLHPMAAHLRRPGQRTTAHPIRPHPDRVRRGLAGPVAACRRRGHRTHGLPIPCRDHGSLVLRRQRGGGAGVRPRDRAHDRRHRRRRNGQPQLGRRVHHPRPAQHAGHGRSPGGRGAGPAGTHRGADRHDDGGGRAGDPQRRRVGRDAPIGVDRRGVDQRRQLRNGCPPARRPGGR
jgi:hypothetical protein